MGGTLSSPERGQGPNLCPIPANVTFSSCAITEVIELKWGPPGRRLIQYVCCPYKRGICTHGTDTRP